jgi:nucleoside-diphosphate-sugar epimerase
VRKILVLGGTGWLGREIAAAAIRAGHSVTCLARGDSGDIPSGAMLERSDRSKPGAYDGVAGTDWDDVIEISWENSFVLGALDALAGRAAHWTLVSTISVYASNSAAGANETAELVETSDLSDYGQAKVAAERASAAALGDRLLIARPGLIAGTGDRSDRFGYWVARLAASDDDALIPVRDGRWVQVIDVRDLARWISRAGAITGTVNAVGNQHSLRETLDRAAHAAGFTGEFVEANDDWLLANDVNYWAGPRSLPLWLPLEDAAMAQRSNDAFLAAGGILRDLDFTLTDTLTDERMRGLDRPRRSGLTRADETVLLKALRD